MGIPVKIPKSWVNRKGIKKHVDIPDDLSHSKTATKATQKIAKGRGLDPTGMKGYQRQGKKVDRLISESHRREARPGVQPGKADSEDLSKTVEGSSWWKKSRGEK